MSIVFEVKSKLKDSHTKLVDAIQRMLTIHFFVPNQMTEFLDSLVENEEKAIKRIRGYRVKVNYRIVEAKG